MPNPSEDENADYLVLVNNENQYSLRPQFCEIPQGWSSVGPRGNEKDCMEWIEQNWTDMRPKSLVDQMNKHVRKE
jgi:MbtH protein